MRAAFEGVCRSEECVYAIVRAEGGTPRARVTPVGASGAPAELPAAVLPLDLVGKTVDGRPAAGLWAVATPRLVLDLRVELLDQTGAQLAEKTLGQTSSKVQSRLLARRRPELVAAVRGIERDNWSGRTAVRLREVWPLGPGRCAWRVGVDFPLGAAGAVAEGAGPEGADPEGADVPAELRLYGAGGASLPVEPIVMEDQVIPDARDDAFRVRRVTFSVPMGDAEGDVCLVASLGGEVGFALVPARVSGELLGRGRYLATGAGEDSAYERWLDLHRATAADVERQRRAAQAANGPSFSVLMVADGTPESQLRQAIQSVEAQSWPLWELIVVNAKPADAGTRAALATFAADSRVRVLEAGDLGGCERTNAGIAAAEGDYLCLVESDGLLEPDALWRYAQAIRRHPEADLLYCDEDRLRDGHPVRPALKVEPQLTLLYSYNYVGRAAVLSRHALDATGRPGADAEGAQDYDLTLRAFEVARDVVHVPHVLYHAREGSAAGEQAHEAGRVALIRHLERRGIAATLEDGPVPHTYRVRFAVPDPAPLASIVIPTQDHADLLEVCVRSVLDRTTYPNYEVVLVENGSRDPATFALYDRLTSEDARVRVVTWEPGPEGFNYSKLCNFGAGEARGDVLVFLNNDTDVIEPGWLDELVGQLQRPEVGVAGAKLLFQDGLVQHAGVAANPAGDNCHVSQNLWADNMGYGSVAGFPCEWSMVTGACQAILRRTLDRAGGFDERLAVGFNDSDLCLTLREMGLVCVCTPYALLHHREFSSRGREEGNPAAKARLLREKAYVMSKHPNFYARRDPGINPNLDPWSGHWELGW